MSINRREAVRRSVVLAALSVVAPGCVGLLGSQGATPGSDGGIAMSSDGGPVVVTPATFQCDPTAVPAEVALPRLSNLQYTNTVTATVTAAAPSIATAVLAEIATPLSEYPADIPTALPGDRHGGYNQLDQDVRADHIAAAYQMAVAIGQAFTSTDARITAVFGACATDASTSNDAACLASFLQRFLLVAHRRPPTMEDVQYYTDAIHGSMAAADLADLVGIVLAGPSFFYRVEHGADLVSGQTYSLDGYELASRLSYLFWQAPPDPALYDAAASGALATDAGYQSQAQRLFDDPRTNVAINSFFHQYLWLGELTRLDSRLGTPSFDAFVGADRPTTTLHTEMAADVTDASLWVTRHGGALGDLFTNRDSFARTDLLAGIYGAPIWNGTDAPPAFGQPERVGLLARAAFLAQPSGNTRPIIKGLFIRHELLCDNIPPPPPGASSTPLPMDHMLTTRQATEELTQSAGSVCSGCHTTLINPMGFASENFDALGRVRTVQTFYDATGAVTGTLPVDTSVVPQIAPGDTRTARDLGDVTSDLVASGRIQTCFAQQYFRFTFDRLEDQAGHTDDCALAGVAQLATAGRPLRDVLLAMALRPEFRRRNFQ